MRHRPALLQTSAALSWITALGTGFDGISGRTDARIFMCALAAGSVLSAVALVEANVTRRIDAAFLAMHQAEVTRPPCQGPPSGPFPAISMEHYRRSGRHANRG